MSATYSIDVDFNATDVQNLNAQGYSLCLSKGTVDSAISDPLPLIWVAKQPFQDNSITWTENYNYYASDSSVQAGANIEQTSYTVDGISLNTPYQFIEGAFQVGGAAQPSATEYVVENDNGAQVILGVSQSVQLDGKTVSSPIFGQSVDNGLQVSYQPQEVISVFLQRKATNGQMISSTGSQVTIVSLSPANPSAKLTYANGHFIINSAYYKPPLWQQPLVSDAGIYRMECRNNLVRYVRQKGPFKRPAGDADVKVGIANSVEVVPGRPELMKLSNVGIAHNVTSAHCE
eukprot:Em0007g1313a